MVTNGVELLTSKGAKRTTVASAADCEVEADRLTAGHERKHNACRAELEVVLVVIPISEECDPCCHIILAGCLLEILLPRPVQVAYVYCFTS